LENALKLGDIRLQGSILYTKSRLLQQSGALQEARLLAEKSLELRHQINDLSGYYASLLLIASNSEPEEAFQIFNDIIEQCNIPYWQALALCYRARFGNQVLEDLANAQTIATIYHLPVIQLSVAAVYALFLAENDRRQEAAAIYQAIKVQSGEMIVREWLNQLHRLVGHIKALPVELSELKYG
jgi:tetratricopeptide (TPR) repeat protein